MFFHFKLCNTAYEIYLKSYFERVTFFINSLFISDYSLNNKAIEIFKHKRSFVI